MDIGDTEGLFKHSHSHALVWAVVPKGSSLLLKDEEVPNSQERVLGNVEVEELGTGKGAKWAELAG